MKCIVLAKQSSRIIAALIDFLIMAVLSIILFLFCLYPITFDKTTYTNNQNVIQEIYVDSGMYVKEIKSNSTYTTFIMELLANDIGSNVSRNDEKLINYLNTYTYNEVTYHPVDMIFKFYSSTLKKNSNEEYLDFTKDPYKFYDNKLTSDEVIEKFKVNSEDSNIASISNSNGYYEISVIDENKRNVTFTFVSGLFTNTSTKAIKELIESSPTITDLTSQNNSMMWKSIVYLIPSIFGVSLIFYLIIPLCSKNGETIGKYIMHLCVLSSDGYELNKLFYIPRYFVYVIVEYILGIVSFGGLFLISYIMFVFTKKRRCLHDYCSNSVVVDKRQSTWFKNREQEYIYMNKTRI